MNLLVSLLKPFIPWATQWVKDQEKRIIRLGTSLTDKQQEDARRAGVKHPDRIHIMVVPTIEPPNHPLLVLASTFIDIIGPHTAGLTLRYGIYIREDCSHYNENRNLFVHEFVHTGQYERLGSIAAFLKEYLVECIAPGYPLGRQEQEAILRAAEIVPVR